MELTRTTGVRKNAERKKQIKKGNSSVRKYKLIRNKDKDFGVQ